MRLMALGRSCLAATSALRKTAVVVAISSVAAGLVPGAAWSDSHVKILLPGAVLPPAFKFIVPITLKSVHPAVDQTLLDCDLEQPKGDGDHTVARKQWEIPLTAGDFAGTMSVGFAVGELDLLSSSGGPEDVKWWRCGIVFKVGGKTVNPNGSPGNYPGIEPAVYQSKPGTASVHADGGPIANTPTGETFAPKVIHANALFFTGQRLPTQLLAKTGALVESILANQPDLIVEKFIAELHPDGSQTGSPIWTFAWQIRNLSNLPAGPTELAISCKPKDLLPCPPGVEGIYPIEKVWGTSNNPGALFLSTVEVMAQNSLPVPDVRARFEFTATVNPSNNLIEASKSNNTLVAQFDSATQNLDKVIGKFAQALADGSIQGSGVQLDPEIAKKVVKALGGQGMQQLDVGTRNALIMAFKSDQMLDAATAKKLVLALQGTAQGDDVVAAKPGIAGSQGGILVPPLEKQSQSGGVALGQSDALQAKPGIAGSQGAQEVESKNTQLRTPMLGTSTLSPLGQISTLKVSSIKVMGMAVAGQPVSLMVTIENTSDKPVQLTEQGLKITCMAAPGGSCTVMKPGMAMALSLQPGQTRTFNLAVKPSATGAYNFAIVPHGAPASSGRSISMAVSPAPSSTRALQAPAPVAPKPRVSQ